MIKHWRIRLLSISLLLQPVILPSQLLAADNWRTVSAETFSLLWKDLTYTRLQVDPVQALPVDGDILEPSYAKQIIIKYKIGVSAERFRGMTNKALANSYSAEELSAAAADIARFCSWYKSVEKGDQYHLAWRPEQGLQLSLNQELLGVIRDPNSAALILSVWLGRAAVSESQRDSMLAAWRVAVSTE
ncbi:MAG: chalcone isomerase family protein [Zhongshania sp.]|uniref:chalcone isomerase family protein n=1 Tax=Zhongshania sp. TaxID=1971902 RepID=UPI002627BBAF|nr:chalcone isomerase family protein [Zhongshania sp.]MDF1692588.1 chalcone isomerase family protein [Zhongshania sp.]